MNYSLNMTDDVSPRQSFDFPLAMAAMSTEQQVFRIIIISAGLLMDGLIVTIIVSSRELHYPRHMFWLAIALVNQIYLVQCSAEIATIFYRNKLACHFFVLNAGVIYSMLLLCLLAAAFDRYLAIARSEWYKRKVANKLTLGILSAVLALTYGGVTSPFWTGHKNISDCSINMTHMHWVLVWNFFLSISCAFLHVKIFLKSRALIRQYPHPINQGLLIVQFQSRKSNPHDNIGSLSVEERDRLSVLQEVVEQTASTQQQIKLPFNTRKSKTNDENIDQSTPVSLNFEEVGCFAPLRPRANRLEILAALYMSINTISLLICTFPATCNGIALYWCMRFKAECSIIVMINPYLHNLLHLHVIYNPIMYMTSSSEFRRALQRRIQKWFPRCSN